MGERRQNEDSMVQRLEASMTSMSVAGDSLWGYHPRHGLHGPKPFRSAAAAAELHTHHLFGVSRRGFRPAANVGSNGGGRALVVFDPSKAPKERNVA